MVSVSDIKTELNRIDYKLKPLDIVLINTKAGERFGHDDYVSSGCGMGYDATIFLIKNGVKQEFRR